MVAEGWETLIQKESERQSELRTFMSRGSRDSAHWKWERIRVASRTRSAPLLSLVAHHVQKKVRMGPGVAGRNRTTNCESGLVAAQVPTGKAGNRILRIGPESKNSDEIARLSKTFNQTAKHRGSRVAVSVALLVEMRGHEPKPRMEICFGERRLERFECSDRRLRYVRDSAYSSLSCGLLWVDEIPIGKFFERPKCPLFTEQSQCWMQDPSHMLTCGYPVTLRARS
jgi:hypothetical protein